MNFIRQGFRKLSSDQQTDRQTDRQTDKVMRGHFRSRNKDGGHTTGSTIYENHVLHANPMALSFLEPGLWATEICMGE